MPTNTYLITFRTTSSTLEQEEIQQKVDESLKEKKLISILDRFTEKKFVNTKVKVRVMDIRWVLRGNKGFLDFVSILKNYSRDKLF